MLICSMALGVSHLPLTTMAQTYLPTPRQTEGPFYPLRPPADQDNDLVAVKGARGIAAGEITHLSGRVLDGNGMPLGGVRVEIWQCVPMAATVTLETILAGMPTPIFRGLAIL